MSWDKIENHLFSKYDVEGEDKELSNLMEEHDKEIRAKAIDEFAEKIQWEYLNSCGLKQREIDFLVAVSSMVAEQMKAGGK
jgi:hypothetical protein